MKRLGLAFLLTFTASLAAQTINPTQVRGVNQQFYADLFTGSDIGAKINAAFLAGTGTVGTPTTGAVVYLAPNGNYSYTTTIVIPNNVSSPYITAPVLDCHGSTLTYTGSGEAFTVMGETSHDTGGLHNCNIFATNPAATVHVWSRTFMRNPYNSFHLGLTGITIINDFSHGGPAFTEEQHWDNSQFSVPVNGCAFTLMQDPSIAGNFSVGSFFYNYFIGDHFDLPGGASKFCLIAGAAPYPRMEGNHFITTENLGGTANKGFRLDNNTSVVRGDVFMTGENTGGLSPQYDIYASGPTAIFNMDGKGCVGGESHGYAAGVPLSNITIKGICDVVNDDLSSGSGTTTLSGEPGGVLSQRQAKNIRVNGDTYFYLPSSGGIENNATFAIITRATDSANQDVDKVGSGSPFLYRFYTDSLNGIGIGPGFSKAANVVSGTDISKPTAGSSEEVRGSHAWRDPTATGTTIGNGGSTIVRSIDHATGDITDTITAGVPGQPSSHYRLKYFDYNGGGTTTALDCNSNTVASCRATELTLVPSTTACSSTTPGKINYVQGAAGVKDIVQVCAKDVANAWAYRTIY